MTNAANPPTSPARRGRPPKRDGAQTPAERKAAQRAREAEQARVAFITYNRADLEPLSTSALAAELGRLVTAGRPALAGAVWEVLEARACAARAELHPEQEQCVADMARRMSARES